MEPRRDDGDDRNCASTGGIVSWPQWSPVVTTGTTAEDRRVCPGVVAAAMEPRRDDGDDESGV